MITDVVRQGVEVPIKFDFEHTGVLESEGSFELTVQRTTAEDEHEVARLLWTDLVTVIGELAQGRKVLFRTIKDTENSFMKGHFDSYLEGELVTLKAVVDFDEN